MRFLGGLGVAVALLTVGCSNPAMPTTMAGSGLTASMTGSWVGATADSTNSMMGAGWSSAAMENMTWEITHHGNTFSGSIGYPGHHGRSMVVSGTVNGNGGTFTMTFSAGSMMMAACTATATGTFRLNDLMTEMHGIFVGTNSCTGPFDHGQMALRRQ